MAEIKRINAREILDSRGNPTIEVDVILFDGKLGRASIPSGASTGEHEAIELRDGDPRFFGGKGVQHAIGNVLNIIAPKLIGHEASDQKQLDATLITLDGTENKSRLGANAILGVSLATARAAALSQEIPLYQHIANLAGTNSFILPVPMFNVLNGGAHADNSVDLQEFMIAPLGAVNFREAIRMGAEVYQALKSTLKSAGYATGVGDEGGFAPALKSNVEALDRILMAIEKVGLVPGKDIVFALDPATSEFFENGKYIFRKSGAGEKNSEEMIEFWEKLIASYPIASLEDGMAEGDTEGWKKLTAKLGTKIQLVGDDNFVTNPSIIEKAIAQKIANASLIKLNQIGTLTETLKAMEISRNAGYGTVISHRSGETPDDFIADFAVGSGALQIKTGAPCRGERIAKYNQLMRIEEELGSRAKYAGRTPFKGTRFINASI